MPYTVLVHVVDEEPVKCELEELPEPTDQTVRAMNPRLRDGKDLPYLDYGVSAVIYPMSRINFIQILQSEDEEEIIGFVRE